MITLCLNKNKVVKSLFVSIFMCSCILCSFAKTAGASQNNILLAGRWNFKLDPEDVGIKDKWFTEKLPDTATLPGSLDEQGLGHKYTEKSLHRLTREYSYVGPAWFQKKVKIPKSWNQKRITLFLEKCHWETTVWVDGKYAGSMNSLSVPHIYDLTDLMTVGEHTLTIRVDNTLKIRLYHSSSEAKWTHEFSDEGQTNWNGIIGRIELNASEKVWIESVRTYPDIENKNVRVNIAVGNSTGTNIKGDIEVDFLGTKTNSPFSCNAAKNEFDVMVPIKDIATLWDEFTPQLYDLTVKINTNIEDRKLTDERSIKIGLRDLGKDGTHFTMNGRKLFLRGKVDSAIFPKTGYPPTSLNEWKRLFNIYKSYGMNHLRFHSWVPVENAFVAADELGFVLQVEPPLWDGYGLVGNDAKVAKFILDEVGRIVDAYGNHPSFCLMSMGNELHNKENVFLEYLVDYLQKKDQRHLYTSTTHPMNPHRKDDYFLAAGTTKGVARGIRPTGNFDNELQGLDRPFLSHELGQPAMYPDFDEIAKYTGPLKAYHLEHHRDTLKRNGIFNMAENYFLASGKHLINIYKENIEAQLRTANMAGFQMLDLQDYPGHGFASIGILDSFCDSKGLITPKEFRRFCCPTVPLLQMKKQIWTNNETFVVDAMVSHFGQFDIKDQKISWVISNNQGEKLASGAFGPNDIHTGSLNKLGKIEMSLDNVILPSQYGIELMLDGTEFVNSWNFWVYPKEMEIKTDDIVICDQWDMTAKSALEEGKKVLLMPRPRRLKNVEKGRWHSVFWSYRLFRQPRTLGALCRPNHLALAQFPTDIYADWQWYGLLENSEGLILDGQAKELDPIVQFVPDFNLNKKLSLTSELSVGKGKLVICTLDLQKNIDKRPATKALLASIIGYMNSDSFKPKQELGFEELDILLESVQTIKDGGKPKNIDKAVLNVKAAVNAKAGACELWQKSLDKVIKQDEGFDYATNGKTWKDAGGSAWHKTNLSVMVSCPKNFEGTFYAHFLDWNAEKRGAALFFAGIDLGPIDRYDGQGIWLKQKIIKEMTQNGQLRLDARVTNGPNVVISQIILLPKETK